MSGSHGCKAMILTCMDFRIQEAVSSFAREAGLMGNYDLVSLAGAQRALLQPDTREATMLQVSLSRELHGIQEVIFVSHDDCGAYGGSKAFEGLESERAHYARDMKEAALAIQSVFPTLKVSGVILVMDEAGNFAGKAVMT